MSNYGYILGFNENINTAFMKLGIPEGNIYTDTGETDTRPSYRKLLRRLQKGDTLYILTLDALGLNMQEILTQWRTLTKDRGVDVVVMNSPLLDTRRGKELNGTLVADIVTEVLTYAVCDDREKRHRRQKEGIERAKNRGIHCGRVAKPLPDNFDTVCRQWKSGEISAADAADQCKMPVSTFRYRANRLEASTE